MCGSVVWFECFGLKVCVWVVVWGVQLSGLIQTVLHLTLMHEFQIVLKEVKTTAYTSNIFIYFCAVLKDAYDHFFSCY